MGVKYDCKTLASATGRIKLSFPEMAEKGGGTSCSTFEDAF